MALVLAIEPDIRQGGILKRIVRELVQAELILVESRDAAIAAIDQQIPDVILLTTLMSPRDEDELITHLRRLGAAEHLQTHTIPLLSAGRAAEPASKGGLLGEFRKRSKEVVEPMGGCDPEMFAEEVRNFLARAAELKAEAIASSRHAAAPVEASRADGEWSAQDSPLLGGDKGQTEPLLPGAPDNTATTAEGATGSTWSSPFEWKSSYSAKGVAHARFSHDNSAAESERQRELAAQAEAERLKMVALEEEAAREREKIDSAAARGRRARPGPAPGSRGARGAIAPRGR